MRIYVHGNCQAPAIARLIKEACPEWQVNSFEVFANPIVENQDEYHRTLKLADVVVSQPVHDGYRGRDDLSLSYVRAAVRPGVPVLVFPSMHFEGQLVGCRSMRVRGYAMDYHDVLLVHLASTELSVAEISAIHDSTDLYPPEFVVSEMNLSLSEAREREKADGVDILFSPFIEEFMRRVQIFHAINHPGRPALVWMARRILSRIGWPDSAAALPFAGPSCILFPHIPCSSSVTKVLSGPGTDLNDWEVGPKDMYKFVNESLTRQEYCSKAVQHIRCYSPNEMVDLLLNPRPKSFLGRLAEARPDLPGIDFWRV